MTFRQLADLVEHRLGATEQAEVETAVAADPEAQATVRWLRGFVDTARAVPLAASSPLVEQRLRQHFARWTEAQEVLGAPSIRTRATIVFDSRWDRPLAGVRGDTTMNTDTVDLVYRCEHAELLLNLRPDRDDRVTLSGQVLLAAETTAPVFEVSVGSAGAGSAAGSITAWRVAESDDLGCFRIDGLTATSTEVRLGNGEVEIVAAVDLSGPDTDPATDDPTGHRRGT